MNVTAPQQPTKPTDLEDRVRELAFSLPPSDLGSTRAIQAVTVFVGNEVRIERERFAFALRRLLRAHDEWVAAMGGIEFDDPISRAVDAAKALLAKCWDLSLRRIDIDGGARDTNLREVHDRYYPAPQPGDDFAVICTVHGSITGSPAPSLPAFAIGEWPETVTVHIVLRGLVEGSADGAGGRS